MTWNLKDMLSEDRVYSTLKTPDLLTCNNMDESQKLTKKLDSRILVPFS